MKNELIFAFFHHQAYSLSFKQRYELWKEMRELKKQEKWLKRIEFLENQGLLNS